jgi:predicted ferric reductase
LHNDDKKRKEYLDSLSTLQVLSLLLSNPEYFYTSSNHLLMDRLKADLKKQNLEVSDLLEQYNLIKERPDLCRNLLFRLMN